MTEAELNKKIAAIDKKLSKLSLPRGEGSIAWKNKSSCYLEYKKPYKFPDGTSKRITAYGYDIDDVRENMHIKEAEELEKWKASNIPSGLNDQADSQLDNTLEESMKYWFYNFNHLNKRGRTFDREEQTLINQVLKYTLLSKTQMPAITDKILQEHFNELMKKYSYSTVKKTYELLDQFFGYYYSKNINANPMNTVVKPREIDVRKTSGRTIKEIRYFTPEEIERFIHEATARYSTGKRIYKFGDGLVFMMYTGLRFGEAVGLTWSDISKDWKYINISQAQSYELERDKDRQSTGRRIRIKDNPKTKAGIRKVYLIAQAKMYLQRLKDMQKPESDQEYIFATSKHAQAVSYYNLMRAFKLICKNCGITDVDESIGLHSLRHTFVSMLCRKHIDKMVVASIVGQSDTKMIEKVYYHVLQEEKDAALKALESDEVVEESVVNTGEEVISASQLAGLDVDKLVS